MPINRQTLGAGHIIQIFLSYNVIVFVIVDKAL